MASIVDQLVDMGFELEMVQMAVESSPGGNMEQAIGLLTEWGGGVGGSGGILPAAAARGKASEVVCEKTVGDVKVQIRCGDLTLENCDAIVNAANKRLMHDAGVAGAIVAKGGQSIQAESTQYLANLGRPLIEGEACVTAAGALACKAVIHAVGPIWQGQSGADACKGALRLAVKASLDAADERGFTSIALPAISSGIFGFPTQLCAQVMLQAICTYCARKPCGGLTEIRLTNYDTPTVDIFQEEFANIDQIAAAEAAASAAANEAAAAGAVGQELARVPVVVDRKAKLNEDVAKMFELVSASGSKYNELKDSWVWEEPSLRFSMASVEMTIHFDAAEYPGSEFTDPFVDLASGVKAGDRRSRVHFIIDRLVATTEEHLDRLSSASGDNVPWAGLDQEQREAAILLGWVSEEIWNDYSVLNKTEGGKEWEELSAEERKAASQLDFDEDKWADLIIDVGVEGWLDMDEEQQAAALQLGWTAASWDGDERELNPSPSGKQWAALTSEEQAAAELLDLDEESWNSLIVHGNLPLHLETVRSCSAKLERDIALLERHLGDRCTVARRPASMPDKTILDITLDIRDLIARDTMKAWKLNPRHGHLTITMEVSTDIYTDTVTPIEQQYFKVYHERELSGSERVAVCVQLEYAVLYPFIQRWWRAKDGEAVLDHITGWSPLSTAENYLRGVPMAPVVDPGAIRTVDANAAAARPTPDASPSFESMSFEEQIAMATRASLEVGDPDAALGRLMSDSGFGPPPADLSLLPALAAAVSGTAEGGDRSALVGALMLSANRPDMAFELYFDMRDRCIATGVTAMAEAEEEAEPEPEVADDGTPLARQRSGDRGSIVARQRSGGDSEDLPADCFLLDLLCYLKIRLPTLNRYCVVQDELHLFEPMLIPTVSCRDLAVFTFQNLDGWWKLAAKEVAAQVEVVDLLVNYFIKIIRSQRWELLLGIDPKSPNHGARTALFPTILQPNGRGELCSPSKPNIAALRQIVDTLPSTREVVNGGDMKATLDARHPAAHDLFQWIITSNRTFLVKLPAQNSIKSIKCAHQFLMKSSTPEKEAKFEALRRRHPVSFVFHGSPMECWHAIARCSLKNVSKTSMMTTGAAYGDGIYTATDMSTSFSYMRTAHGRGGKKDQGALGSKYIDVDTMSCMAICEVIDSTINGTSTINKNGGIWVVPNADHVTIRFLLVWDSGTPFSGNFSTVAGNDELRSAADLGFDILDTGAHDDEVDSGSRGAVGRKSKKKR